MVAYAWGLGIDSTQSGSRKVAFAFQEEQRRLKEIINGTKKLDDCIIAIIIPWRLGIDRLYLGYKNWWLKLITLGGCGIWSLYDFIMIVLNKMPDGEGQPLAK